MNRHLRSVARLGAALLVSAGLVLPAAPAHAEDPVVDIAVDVVGTRLAEGTTNKLAVVKVSNHGTFTPDLIALHYVARNFDYRKVQIDPLLEDLCEVDGDTKFDTWDCGLRGEQIPGPGETVELPLLVFKTTDKLTEPYRTTLGVSVTPWNNHKTLTDANPADNYDEYEVVLTTEHGADLTVVAPDIKREIAIEDARKGDLAGAPLNPGDKTVAVAYLENQGDRVVSQITVRMTVPKGVTFGSLRTEECGFSDDKRTFHCPVDVHLVPHDPVAIILPVTVSAGVKAPATLPGGTVSISADTAGNAPAEGERSSLPEFLGVPLNRLTTLSDIDERDNSDDFAVFVTPAAGGDGDGGNGGGGNGGGDGGLPVTGPQVGLLAGAGTVVLAAGAVLFLAARRRRVVLVAPGDEKPAA
ncbi:hypothetical protein GA0074695_0063 [Micromonospora viridifaciens]|uniref:LPXTG-motif cell wall anchor domain-containing protein n=1 Tax=Micromonospora viridifaciens TaxID=1881 RepID=A0A1C4U1L8_MICVI|nr:hypothetical protein [Micromonospora viridifaciens]SCE65497.1 hypothetical protein GA0074695_0063 [Micromonospora viridifaciens]